MQAGVRAGWRSASSLSQRLLRFPRDHAASGNDYAMNWSLARQGLAPTAVAGVYRNVAASVLASASGSETMSSGATEADLVVQSWPAPRLRRLQHDLVERYLALSNGAVSAAWHPLYVVDAAVGSHLPDCVPVRVVCDQARVALGFTHVLERLPARALRLEHFEPEVTVYVASQYAGWPSNEKPMAVMTPDGTRLYVSACGDAYRLRQAMATAAATELLAARAALSPDEHTMLLNGSVMPNGAMVLGARGNQCLWSATGVSRAWRETRFVNSSDAESPSPPSGITAQAWSARVRWSFTDDDRTASAGGAEYLVPEARATLPNVVPGAPRLYLAVPDEVSGTAECASPRTAKKGSGKKSAKNAAAAAARAFTVTDADQVAGYAMLAGAFPLLPSMCLMAAKQLADRCRAAQLPATLVVGENAQATACQMAAGNARAKPDAAVPEEIQTQCRRRLLDISADWAPYAPPSNS